MEQQAVRLTDVLNRLWIASQRMGNSAYERLRWLVGFLGRDLSRLREGEWLDLEDDLKTFATGTLPQGPQGSKDLVLAEWNPMTPLTREEIHRLQNDLNSGLKSLLETGRWDLPKVAAPVFLKRIHTDSTGRTRIVKHYKTSLWDSIVLQAIDIFEWGGNRIRACQECHQPFLAIKRQIYCSRQCSQRIRDRRFRERNNRSSRRSPITA